MAATYRVAAPGIIWAVNKNILAIYNGAGSGKIVRVYRVWMFNGYTASVTGILFRVSLGRFTGAPTGGSAAGVYKHDSASAAVPAQVTSTTASTVITITDVFRRILWSSDEAAPSLFTMDEWELFPALMCIWDAGYSDTNIEPITLRETYGLVVQVSADAGAHVSSVDTYAEMTIT